MAGCVMPQRKRGADRARLRVGRQRDRSVEPARVPAVRLHEPPDAHGRHRPVDAGQEAPDLLGLQVDLPSFTARWSALLPRESTAEKSTPLDSKTLYKQI